MVRQDQRLDHFAVGLAIQPKPVANSIMIGEPKQSISNPRLSRWLLASLSYLGTGQGHAVVFSTSRMNRPHLHGQLYLGGISLAARNACVHLPTYLT